MPGPPVYFARKLLLVNLVFWAGASVMLIEISANRILAPWFGNTLFTWTGLIGVILCAMSGGYYFGGWLADRVAKFATLGHLLLIAAVFTLLVPAITPLLDDRFSHEPNIILGPVIASLVLFAIPGFLLATVSPYAIKLISMLSGDRQVGVSAGVIGMFSTLGSVLGTFFAGFVLIPNMGIRMIFMLVGAVLALLAAFTYCFFLSPRRKAISATGLVCVLAATLITLCIMTTPSTEPGVVFDETTFYHRIRVLQEDTKDGDILRTLMLDSTSEGSQYLSSGDSSIPYQSYWELARFYCPGLQRAAFLGAGAFMMPEKVCDAFPNAEVDVVDIDPRVVDVGREFFRVDDFPRLNPVAEDARLFLASSDVQYDLIFGDAYNGVRAIPAHLVTKEFFGLVKDRLSSNGVYMMNIISALDGDQSALFQSIAETLHKQFSSVQVYALYPNYLDYPQNVIFVAANSPLPDDPTKSIGSTGSSSLDSLLGTYIQQGRYTFITAPVFTDNFNPVDYIIARNLMNTEASK